MKVNETKLKEEEKSDSSDTKIQQTLLKKSPPFNIPEIKIELESSNRKINKEQAINQNFPLQKDITKQINFPNFPPSSNYIELNPDKKDLSKSEKNTSLLNKKRYGNLEGSRSIDNYEHIGKIDEGAYGVVYKARDKETGDVVAIKKVKLGKEKDGFPITSIREINILMNYKHDNIVNIKEVVYGSTADKIFCVMDYADYELKALLSDLFINTTTNTLVKRVFSISQIKSLLYQLLKGVEYMHDNWLIHRDLKTSNLLYDKNGILKIADFGLARKYGNPLKPYTPLVVTLWYRAPELLLNCEKYGTAIDIWSCGCILAEMLLGEPLFQGQDEIDQLHKIFKLMGTPNEKQWPGWSQLPNAKRINFTAKQYLDSLREKFPKFSYEDDFVLTDKGFDLLKKLLSYDPDKRPTAEEALSHPWFYENPKIASKDNMPDFSRLALKEKVKGNKKMLKSLNEEQIKQREKLHNEERYEVKLDQIINDSTGLEMEDEMKNN